MVLPGGSPGPPPSSRRTSARRLPVLRLDGIDAGYAGTQVLSGVGLEAKHGAMTVIIGSNGSGKSTILKVITGLLRPTRGTVVFQGGDITNLPAHERPERGSAVGPEGPR